MRSGASASRFTRSFCAGMKSISATSPCSVWNVVSSTFVLSM